MQSQNTLNQLSRRNWLRNAAIGATGAVVLPWFLTGCADHMIPEPGGLGATPAPTMPIADFDLYGQAAQNLQNMEAWITALYPYCLGYETGVFELLQSGDKGPSDWKDFLSNAFTKIGIGLLQEVGIKFPLAGPVFGIITDFIKLIESSAHKPDGLSGTIATFTLGHNAMQMAITQKLIVLADPTDNYSNLREAFKEGDVEFNGQKYNLTDLAHKTFPTKEGHGTEYVAMQKAAYDRFRKYYWNMIMVKCGKLNRNWEEITYALYGNPAPSELAFRDLYQKYRAAYVRGRQINVIHAGPFFAFHYWYFTFDGRELPEGAVHELFKDDYPHHEVRSDALFYRDHVFKQFHRERPDFSPYYELRADLGFGSSPEDSPSYGFDPDADNYEFTGGEFPMLVKK
ncbi:MULTISPECIES: hypothetical protein [Spirosoma]|uniref:Uncharacterized protein n=1 Tax=Spirosoma liriopis TaxID=2937440 RepID=A0ABT0HTT7_9BACT|nr:MULTISPECIES: hypothetical protein [Spirosoma]MCK8495581.1 hypothetical protein [Spirosoma liriopis]UHG94609.1 hypothetical protein LQ777_28060 [Spirosoma oryzicola]